MENVTKMGICSRMAKKINMPATDIKCIVESFLSEIIEVMAEDRRIEIRGFGAFLVKRRMSRVCRNPRTGETVPVPEYDAPTFKFSKDALDAFKQIKSDKNTDEST